MSVGQLVKWSWPWLSTVGADDGKREHYRNQIGVLIEKSSDTINCWLVVWNDGEISTVHKEYLEVA